MRTWAEWYAEAVRRQEEGEPLVARRAARAAIAVAGDERERAESRLVLAWVSHRLGDDAEAEALIAVARPGLGAGGVVRADCLGGLIQCAAGRYAEAVGVLAVAVAGLAGKPRWRANALVGLGVAAGHLGRFAEADRALAEAGEVYAGIGEVERAATCVHNRGFLAAEAGEHARAVEHYAASGVDEGRWPEVLVDRARSELALGLVRTADATLARAEVLLAAAGRAPAFAEALLARAEHALGGGDRETAARTATRAAELFRDHRLPELGARARELARRAVRVDAPARVERARSALTGVSTARDLHERNERLLALHTGDDAEPAPLDDPALVVLIDRGGTLLALSTTDLREIGDTARITAAARAFHRHAVLAEHSASGKAPADMPAPGLLDAGLFPAGHASPGLPPAGLVPPNQASPGPPTAGLFPTGLPACGVPGAGLSPARQAAVEFARLLGLPAGRRTVVVPTPALAGLPWGLLPGGITVAPSVAAYRRAEAAPEPTGPRLWIAGPGLDHAVPEVTALHRAHGGTLLVEPTVDAAREAIGRAGWVHIAAHGHHRAGAPGIDLGDGTLHPHHLGGLRRGPGRVVLAACEVGHPYGFPLAFLRLGAKTVVGSPIAVRDRGGRGPGVLGVVGA
ncbi:CHAT domain-containing protein [Actinokineospora spheciospongiae]|uniref:CHAT domain-containing protein n=1 Tax=Actinokineospora spheciospongiae TaxID=909613 RepID=UPI000D930C4B|nr:CHAT domain-containing protein [Actinokineospora spheciospongiae]PWW64110.1 CHAT domain-containing protein [Actinokineospora spheciospongiae]